MMREVGQKLLVYMMPYQGLFNACSKHTFEGIKKPVSDRFLA